MNWRFFPRVVLSALLILAAGMDVLAEEPQLPSETPEPPVNEIVGTDAGDEAQSAPESSEEAPAEDVPPPEDAASIEAGAEPPSSAEDTPEAERPSDGAAPETEAPETVPESPPEAPPVDTPPASLKPKEIPPKEVPADDPRFLDKSWDEVITDFLKSKHAGTDNVGIVYYNTVTGEQHMLNGDKYFYAASLYKLPLNMYFGEKIYNGEMSMDDKIYGRRYGDMQKSSLQFSSNPVSELLQGYLGGQREYVNAILPYLLDEGETWDEQHTYENSFTPKQMKYALKLLYESPERYPDVLDYLKEANPDTFFRLIEQRFTIAQKYGWIVTDDLSIANCAGIIWTDEPILLVFMSNYIPGSVITIGEFAVLMSDYSQYWSARHAEEAEAEAAALAAAEAESEEAPSSVPQASETPATDPASGTEEPEEEAIAVSPEPAPSSAVAPAQRDYGVAVIITLAAAAAAVIGIIIWRRKK